VPSMSTSEDPRFSFSATNNPSVRLAYWDQNAYLHELVVSETPPINSLSTAEQTSKSTAQSNSDSVTANTKDGDSKSKKRKAEPNVPNSNKKAMPSHLQFWKDRHAELHGVEKKPPTEEDGPEEANSIPEPKELPQLAQSYADMNKKCCYLCSRQFKTEAEVNKHERLSDLHRTNLNNEQLKAKAISKLAKARIGPKGLPLTDNSNEASEYRDRAKERREAYGQPKKPKPGSNKPNSKKPSSDQEDDNDKPRPSKGASLLGKMGWSEGQGLGREGTGMVAPIATELYAQGVGLGMAGGKLGDAVNEAERRTKGGYEAFLEKAKEGARERFENMKD
jgi:RNA-binding protein 5/10